LNKGKYFDLASPCWPKKMRCQKGRILSSDERILEREVSSRWNKLFNQKNQGQMCHIA
jgi:hypothetical protein